MVTIHGTRNTTKNIIRNNPAMKIIIIFVLCFTALLLVKATPVIAKNLSINSSIQLQEKYTDNLFLTKTNREHDYITTISPSIGVKYKPNGTLDLNFNYGINFRFYTRHSELNDTSIGETQNIRFHTTLKPLNRVVIDISDIYEKVPVDERRPVAFENFVVNMTDSNRFNVSPYIEIPLTKTISSRFGYSYNNVWFKNDEANDYYSHSAFSKITKRFPQGISTYLNYRYYAYRPYDPDAEYDKHLGSVGADLDLQAVRGLTVYAEAGISRFDYSYQDDETFDFWNVGIKADRKIQVTGNISLRAGYGTSFHDSNTEGVAKREKVDLSLMYETDGQFKLTINPYYVTDEFLTTEREDKIIGVAINCSKPLTRKITPSIRGLWERHELLPEDETRNRYSVHVSFDYRLSKRITTGVGYIFNTRTSSIEENEYHNNIVLVNAKMTLL
jgi:hypothetical protein